MTSTAPVVRSDTGRSTAASLISGAAQHLDGRVTNTGPFSTERTVVVNPAAVSACPSTRWVRAAGSDVIVNPGNAKKPKARATQSSADVIGLNGRLARAIFRARQIVDRALTT